MGRSYSIKAGNVLDAVVELAQEGFREKLGHFPQNWIAEDGSFYELGREQPDGAITGVIYRPHPTVAGYYCKGGSFRIEADGKITRFPVVSKVIKKRAESLGVEKFRRVYEIEYYRPEFEQLQAEIFGPDKFVVVDTSGTVTPETEKRLNRYTQLLGLFHPSFRISDWKDPRFE